MSLSIEELLLKIDLPKQYFDNDFTIYDKYKKESKKFIDFVNECDGHDFFKEDQTRILEMFSVIIDEIKKNVESILKIFESYENCNHKIAQEEFDALMIRLKDDLFISTIDDIVILENNGKRVETSFRSSAGHRYFRVRPVEYESSEIQKNADELFHIPLTKRAYANNERFSIAGFPSLYLATMLPLAWQECGYPEKYYYSEYQYKYSYDQITNNRSYEQEFRFLSLYSPNEIFEWGIAEKHNHFTVWLKVIERYLKMYPLVLACSFVNQSGKVIYKQEYIIPQMLMQWVYRNNNFVHGISYFTCKDTYTQTINWCAYNIAIPIQPPYDEKKYSIKLRESFSWTKPQFFVTPIANHNINKNDQKDIYNFIGEIKNATRSFRFPKPLNNFLIEALNISCSLLSLLQNGNTTKIELALRMLESLSLNYDNLKKQKLEELIELSKKDRSFFNITQSTDDNNIYSVFKKLYTKFIGTELKTDSIGKIINRYEWTSWNEYYPHSEVIIFCTESSDSLKPLNWLKENHILSQVCLLENNESSLDCIKKLSKSTQIPLSEFWMNFEDDDEWMKNNIQSIKSPILIKINDTSIYSSKDISCYEFCQIGFDTVKLSKLLGL